MASIKKPGFSEKPGFSVIFNDNNERD